MKKHIKLLIVLGIVLLSGISFFLGKESKEKDIFKEESSNIKKKDTHLNSVSMMLETKANSGNYEMTTRDSWPTEGYIFNLELSKCENGGELSWDNEKKVVLMSGNVSDKCYVYFDKVLTLANYVKEQYNGVQGNNNIYYHNGTLENGINDGSYRYAGASDAVNNYVCISNENPCSDKDLFRIIGVFDERVKLIKATPSGNKPWDSNGSNTWSTASLNKYLNGEYLISLGNFANKIDVNSWKVGGNTFDKITLNVIPKVAFQNEIISPNPINSSDNAKEYTAKIGLMYVTDYYYTASSNYWGLYGLSYDSSKGYASNGYNSAADNNWLFVKNLNQWTITRDGNRDGFGINRVYNVGDNGIVGDLPPEEISYASINVIFRPTFYLSNSVSYLSGSGTSSDPIILGD